MAKRRSGYRMTPRRRAALKKAQPCGYTFNNYILITT